VTDGLRVALTFDIEHPDRPSIGGVTERILDVLDAHDVRATMFIQGRWASAYPQLARSIADAGHLVGNHSHFHARMPMLSRTGFASDVQSATRVIRDVIGVDPRPWFRCPFGALDGGTRVLDSLTRLGYRNVGWHVDSRDWAAQGTPAMIRRVIDGVAAHGDGAIVLMHGWPRPTGDALPSIIHALRDAGADFVTVADLPDIPRRAAWDTR
jgi:peptidoglycan-N-acetylglucosamine deacetylase